MKEAIILAGGLGTRLQSVVNDRPKCMAMVAGKPFLKYILDFLSFSQIDHVVLSLGYKYEIIQDWLNNQQYSFKISFVIEDKPLGTGGAIFLALSKLKTDSCFVLNGDTFFKVDLNEMQKFHCKNAGDITLALKPMSDFDRYGSVVLDTENKITEFQEKEYKKYGLINGGIYFLNKSILDKFNNKNTFSFEKEILEGKNQKINIIGFKSENYFIDIGIPSDYERANVDFLKYKNLL